MTTAKNRTLYHRLMTFGLPLAVAAGFAWSAPVAAQDAGDYPGKVVRIMVPQAAGGAVDLIARMVSEERPGTSR